MKVILVGEGKLVYHLARSLLSKGYNVTIVSKNREFCEDISKTLKLTIVNGDPTKIGVLESAEPTRDDILVALTQRDQDNLMVCQLARNMFTMDRVFSLVNDPDNLEIFKKLGFVYSISTTEILVSMVEQKISLEDIINLIPVEEGKISILEIDLKSGSPMVGRKLGEIGFPKGALIGSIIRQGNVLIPHGGTVLEEGDRLLIICLAEVQSEVLKFLKVEE